MINLHEVDLSSNCLTEFPTDLALCRALKELRLIHNEIREITHEFLVSELMPKSLEVLILNNNPLQQITPEISKLAKLKVLGIASTQVRKLPN